MKMPVKNFNFKKTVLDHGEKIAFGLIALLGLLAVAGYQHRDKLGELFGRISGRDADAAPATPPGTFPIPSRNETKERLIP